MNKSNGFHLPTNTLDLLNCLPLCNQKFKLLYACYNKRNETTIKYDLEPPACQSCRHHANADMMIIDDEYLYFLECPIFSFFKQAKNRDSEECDYLKDKLVRIRMYILTTCLRELKEQPSVEVDYAIITLCNCCKIAILALMIP